MEYGLSVRRLHWNDARPPDPSRRHYNHRRLQLPGPGKRIGSRRPREESRRRAKIGEDEMIDERALAAEKLLALYLCLPQTPSRLSRQDRKLARELIERKTPPELIEAAMLLAIARRSFRDPSLPPLGLIRSFHYFLPVIDEVL